MQEFIAQYFYSGGNYPCTGYYEGRFSRADATERRQNVIKSTSQQATQ